MLPYLRHLTPEAASLGAVNTLVQRDGALDADNTDARGLQAWFATLGATLAGRPALLLGAGGASRAAIVALAGLGASRIHLLNRTVARAEQVAADLRPRVPNVPIEVAPLDRAASEAPAAMGVVINATSLGHHGSAPVVHPSWYGTGGLGVELVYNPPETPFMREARAAGARTENGLGMLIHQAVVAFELWTGVKPDIAIYEQAAARALEERKAHA